MGRTKKEAPASPETELTPQVVSDIKSLSEPVKGQTSYYVWNEKTEHVATFDEDIHKGEAFKHAKELADQHPGWTIS